jgi:hypothetical protein
MEAVPSLPLLDAHQRVERFRANMGSVQLHAQSAWLGLARQSAKGRVHAARGTGHGSVTAACRIPRSTESDVVFAGPWHVQVTPDGRRHPAPRPIRVWRLEPLAWGPDSYRGCGRRRSADERYGEELCAWVRWRAGAEPLDADAVRAPVASRTTRPRAT